MKKTLKVEGMHCTSCKMLIEDALEDREITSKINEKSGIVEVDFDENKITIEEIKRIIKQEGFKI